MPAEQDIVEGVGVTRSAPRANPRRRRRSGVWTPVLISLSAMAGVLLLGALFFSLSDRLAAPAGKSAIVDQLNLTYASPEFVQNATAILKQAGYAVDYYPSQQGTVEFYRRLPTLGYRVIILRVHTPRLKEPDGTLGDDVALVTSDAYSPDGLIDRKDAPFLVRVFALTGWPLKELYGITDGFVQSRMEGNFQGATVILTGCSGLRSEKMARALVARGARDVIAWDGEVAPVFSDSATDLLLKDLLLGKLSVSQAVSHVRDEVGPDPYWGGQLVSYPPRG